MFHLFSNLRGFAIETRDGTDGAVDDLYFDDAEWRLRYVVGDVGPILFGRKALLGVEVLRQPDLARRVWPVDLTREEVETAPRPEEADAEPVGAQRERQLRRYRDVWPSYILGPAGAGFTPVMAEEHLAQLRREQETALEKERPAGDPHLRSMGEVCGYDVRASDGRAGVVEDFVIDPADWRVGHLVVASGEWFPDRPAVIPTRWIEGVSWEKGEVAVGVTRERLESSPRPDDLAEMSAGEIDAILAHYGVPPA